MTRKSALFFFFFLTQTSAVVSWRPQSATSHSPALTGRTEYINIRHVALSHKAWTRSPPSAWSVLASFKGDVLRWVSYLDNESTLGCREEERFEPRLSTLPLFSMFSGFDCSDNKEAYDGDPRILRRKLLTPPPRAPHLGLL